MALIDMALINIKPTEISQVKRALTAEEKKKKYNEEHLKYYRENREKLNKRKRELRSYRKKERMEIARLLKNNQDFMQKINENTKTIMNILDKMT